MPNTKPTLFLGIDVELKDCKVVSLMLVVMW